MEAYHVDYRDYDKKWEVRLEDSVKASALFDTRAEAYDRANELAKSYKRLFRDNTNVYYVSFHSDDEKWHVKFEGAAKTAFTFEKSKRGEAIYKAMDLARTKKGRVVVRRENGEFCDSFSFES